jgi:hypothetical protein
MAARGLDELGGDVILADEIGPDAKGEVGHRGGSGRVRMRVEVSVSMSMSMWSWT